MIRIEKPWRLAALTILGAACALAQPEGKRLNIPAVITEPGLYQLPVDSFNTGAGAAIRVMASGVTIDLNGRQIQGNANNTGVGVHVVGAMGVAIRNGNIANFGVGVLIENSHNVTVTDLSIRARNLVPAGGPPESAITIVQSTSVVVRDNNISNTGLGIFVRGGDSRANTIVNNSLAGGTNGVIGICYNPAESDPRSPRYDMIEGNLISGYRTGIQFASSSGPNAVRRNTIFHRGVTAIGGAADTGALDEGNVKIQIQ